ncbi:MAG: class I SAM-dependent methyltransferase [Nanoarchaeota archaeon]|nr:class I SAM-dependent methyltransferase [Nanoarchaeota archaeon]MCG2717779.1 class I SAM-dependent methyltransferase [Nanoarchaeota archaeon]
MSDTKSTRWSSTERFYGEEKEIEEFEIKFRKGRYKVLLEYIEPILKIKIDEDTRVLEVGCGYVPFVSILTKGNLYALDPFSIPKVPGNFRFEKTGVEDYKADAKFDLLFSLNVIDHVKNMNEAIRKISDLTMDKGYLILSLCTYNDNLSKLFFRYTNRWFDKPHPYHFDKEDFVETVQKNSDFRLIHFNDDMDKNIYPPQLTIDNFQRNFVNKKRNIYLDVLKSPSTLIRIIAIRIFTLISRKPFRPRKLYIFQKK